MKKRPKLKNCPFCGGNEVHSGLCEPKGGPLVGHPYWYVSCYDCDFEGFRMFLSDYRMTHGLENDEMSDDEVRDRTQEICERLWNMRKGWNHVIGKKRFLPGLVLSNMIKFWTFKQIDEFADTFGRWLEEERIRRRHEG